ncbi:hypothetical protein BDL97_02G089700 [Sphagnum fallax]|nr:hypothetical protein BDL97_02G089700 [Sphagnum fallax]
MNHLEYVRQGALSGQPVEPPSAAPNCSFRDVSDHIAVERQNPNHAPRMRGSISGPGHFSHPNSGNWKPPHNNSNVFNSNAFPAGMELSSSDRQLHYASNGQIFPPKRTMYLPDSNSPDQMEQHFGMVPNDGGNAAGTEFDHNFQDFSRKPNRVNPSPNRCLEKPFLRQGQQKTGQMSRPGVSNSCSLSPHGETPQDELGRTGERQVDTVQATSVCNKLWTELQSAMGARERAIKAQEARVMQISNQKAAITEEKKVVVAMRNEVIALREQTKAERLKMEDEANEARAEKEVMERFSTDIAVQLAELRQTQRQLEKDKAALEVQKAELEERKKTLEEWEHKLLEKESSLAAIETKKTSKKLMDSASCEKSSPLYQPGAENFDVEDGLQTLNNRTKVSPILVHEGDDGIPTTHVCKVIADTVEETLPTSQGLSVIENPREEGDGQIKIAMVKTEAMQSDTATGGGIQSCCEGKTGMDGNDGDGEEDVSMLNMEKWKFEHGFLTPKREMQPQDLALDVYLPLRKKTTAQKQESERLGGRPLSYDPTFKRSELSIEAALQEDAPGLLEKLKEKGLLEDMHVYGDAWANDPEEVELSNPEFGDLQSVIGKLWGSTSGVGKDLAVPKGQGNTSMPRYCLACLVTLIEQTKSLRRRKWPVEWGWCRRLRSFLFVFEKHNRIVLERPEYGFATYFFELVQSLPVRWQVKRLVTVMSVASSGRAALLENRQLEVGRDLSTEEAAVLEDYGWNPSSGLGSLLNFCHRVVHDHSRGDTTELATEWKIKIGKLLMDGYDHGSIVKTLPRKLQQTVPDDLGMIECSVVKEEIGL